MADRTFASLVPKVNPSAPGCPTPTMIQYIRDAAIYVCEQTLAWRHAQVPYNLTPGISYYDYQKPVGSDVHAVFTAIVNDFPLDRVTLEQALERYPAWVDNYSGLPDIEFWPETGTFNTPEFNENPFNDGTGFTIPADAYGEGSEPRLFTQLTPDGFVVIPMPDNMKAYSLRLIYALKPKRDSSGMPENIFNDLEDCIVHRALQELLVLPNHSWTDRELASYHARQARYRITERRARANVGNMRASVSVQMRPFY